MSAGAPSSTAGATSGDEAAIGAALDGLRSFRHRYWAPVLLGIIMLFDSWDAVAIAYVMPTLSAEWHLEPLQMGLLMSAGYGGQFIGAFALGAVAERLGRMPVILLGATMMSVLALVCAIAPDYETLFVTRLVQGVMIGGALPVAITYINELAPTKTRGRYFGLFQTLAMSGIAIAAISSPIIIPQLGWRWMFGLGAVPLALLPLVGLTLPESPRWLLRVDRPDAANRALIKLGGAPLALSPESPLEAPQQGGKVRFGALFSGELRPRTLTVSGLWFLTIFISSGLTNWAPTLYVKSFHIAVAKALTFAAVTSLIMFIALTMSGYLIDRFGRRPLALGGMLLTAVPLLLVAALRPSFDLLIFAAFLIAQTACFFGTFTLWPYTAEIYPTRTRALALGFANSIGRGASMLMPVFVGAVMNRGAPIQIVLALFGVFAVAAFAIWATRTRETAGLALGAS